MNHTKFHSILTIFLVLSIGFLSFGVGTAQAAAPANDDFDSATQITQIPFTEIIDTTEATLVDDDPAVSCGWGYFNYNRTVWYSITPTRNMGISISKSGNNQWADIYVFTGSRGSLSRVAGYCNEWDNDIRFAANSGTVYYIMVAAGNYVGNPGEETLVLNIAEVPPPPNDDFTDAIVVGSLPFTDNVDTEFASREQSEPNPCNIYDRTIWYAFTPESFATYTVKANHPGEGALAAYTDDELGGLTELACSNGYTESKLILQMQPGTTYYFQTAADESMWGWNLTFYLDFTPPPDVNYWFDPGDPSKFDMIQFNYFYWDPGGMEHSAYWDFGDGTTSTESYPVHHYTSDGDYTAQLTVTASDGRSATISSGISVRTHDVVITRFTVPQSASAGQTRQITVPVNNKYYDETVKVLLYKSSPGGYVEVGTLTLYVPVRPTNRAVPFAFSYTFTPEDAAIGKVTFKAVAELQGTRDALPADNEVIALPTRVGR